MTKPSFGAGKSSGFMWDLHLPCPCGTQRRPPPCFNCDPLGGATLKPSKGILTRDSDRGMALAERIEAGIVHINDQPVNDEPQVPFGGVKDSGYGRFGGGEAMHEFTEMRWGTVQGQGGRPFPF